MLKCIRCGSDALRAEDEVHHCGRCGARYPIVNRVAQFVADQRYAGSFGFQWNCLPRTQLDSANGTTRTRDEFIEKTGWSLTDLQGKRVLDAGCGMGRYAEICARAGAEVHAVDLSGAVEAAARNLGHRPNVHIYQADIMDLPFRGGTFDRVFSLGVLHHTPNTEAAFLKLVPLLKPGGAIAIWVYSTALLRYWGGEWLRKVTPSLPTAWLLRACKIAIPLYYVHRLPLVGRVTSMLLPTNVDPDPEWRWLGTFDWYSPTYQWKYSCEEVEGWFRRAGLADIRQGPFPVSVRGVRPPAPEA